MSSGNAAVCQCRRTALPPLAIVLKHSRLICWTVISLDKVGGADWPAAWQKRRPDPQDKFQSSAAPLVSSSAGRPFSGVCLLQVAGQEQPATIRDGMNLQEPLAAFSGLASKSAAT